jgi:endonuclease/exonuclease/phosphatase family metal-dependent hydrolase
MRPKHLSVLTLNLWGENGSWESRLAYVAAKLDSLRPDVIALQEVREAPGRVDNQAELLARHRGLHHVFAPSTAWGGGHEGLAILSRFPIGEHHAQPLPHSAEKEGRILLSARLDSPFGELWVHTTHLSYRENEGRQREEQVMAIDEAIAGRKSDNPQVLMGDFNAVPHSDEIRWLCGLTTLGGRRVFYQDSWDVAHAGKPGYTWSRANPYIGNMSWLRGDRRLDYVFVTAQRRDGRGRVHDARVFFDEPQVMPGGDRLFASDHFAVVADIQLAPDEPV